MAFLIHTVDYGHTAPWEYLPAGAITPKVGKALVLSGGVLAASGATTKPTHISMRDEDAALTSGTIIPVVKADPAIVWETTFSAAASSVTVGSKVTLSADGMQVTGTTTDGVATVVWMEDKVAGAKVRVRFE